MPGPAFDHARISDHPKCSVLSVQSNPHLVRLQLSIYTEHFDWCSGRAKPPRSVGVGDDSVFRIRRTALTVDWRGRLAAQFESLEHEFRVKPIARRFVHRLTRK